MKKRAAKLISDCRADFSYKTTFFALISAVVGLTFTVYNGFLGIIYHSLWNGAVCVYYVLLALVRLLVIRAMNLAAKACSDSCQKLKEKSRHTYLMAKILLFLINLALIIPIVLMIEGKRDYAWGLIPAIAFAAYTTYRMTMAIINFRRSRRTKNPFIMQLRNISLIDALVAILLLQNTLITAVDGEVKPEMKTLTIGTSTAIWLTIALISLFSLFAAKGRIKGGSC